MGSPMWSRVEGVQAVVVDFQRGVDDLRRLLGRAPAWTGRCTESGAPLATFALANTTLELTDPAGLGPGTDLRRTVVPRAGEGLCALRLAALPELGPASAPDGPSIEGALRARGLVSGSIRTRRAAGQDGAPDRCWSEIPIDVGPAGRGLPVEAVREEGAFGFPSGEEVPPDPARVQALDHVVVLSPDLEATRRLFGDALGIRLALDRRFEARGVRLLFFRLGGVTIEIGGRLDAAPRPGAPDRFGGLAWQVGDAEAAKARLVAEGFDVSAVRDGHKPGTRVCTVRAPVHGVPTLLIEHVGRDGPRRSEPGDDGTRPDAKEEDRT